MNEGNVRPLFKNVRGRLVSDKFDLTFINQTLRSRDRRFNLTLPKLLKDVPNLPLPAQPNGLYQVFVTPERYRSASVFLAVLSGRVNKLELDLFLMPDKAIPRFPSFHSLDTNPEWADLGAVLKASGIGDDEYRELAPEQKGSLFNLHAKMQAEKFATGESVFSFMRTIVRVDQDRVFFRAKSGLLRKSEDHSGFRSELGTLHDSFSDGFKRIASFKTREKVGNLQLTIARNAANQLEVDADLDDHSGILHAFDVLKHTITGDETHPFNIHQVLLYFHHIDPGYDLL